MNFYLLLDTSPSMEIAGTQDGIQTMIQNTQSQINGSSRGCAFACHESNPGVCPAPFGGPSWLPPQPPWDTNICGNPLGQQGTPYYSLQYTGTDGNTYTAPTGIDNYQLAKNLGVKLRIDMVADAAAAMLQTAIQQEQAGATYQIAINTFDVGIHTLFPLTANLSSLQSSLSASPSPIQPLEVYRAYYQCTNFDSNGNCTQTQKNYDTDTNIDAALTAVNTPSAPAYIPNPNDVNATQVLIIVTDGMENEQVSSPTAGNLITDPAGGDEQIAPFAANSNVPSYSLCQAIKARGVKIAILYAPYIPLDSGNIDSWYDQNIEQFQPGASLANDQIGPDLQNNCASPGLFMTVPPSNDAQAISNGLVQLFLLAKSSHLTE
jgi:hypothetical protein